MLPTVLKPYAKAVAPFVSSLAGVAVLWLLTGTYDQAEAGVQVTGLIAALATFLTKNTPA